ncbi:MAG: hypothetical protein ACON35_01350 [Candidatus Marinamargulisbacteria bacterium]
MSITIKRSVHVHVRVDASFKKKYILFASKLIEDLNYRLHSYEVAIASDDSTSYQSFIQSKINETKLQIAQLNQRMTDIKQCKNGESFRLSVLDGTSHLAAGDDVIKALAPIVVETDGATITNIIS